MHRRAIQVVRVAAAVTCLVLGGCSPSRASSQGGQDAPSGPLGNLAGSKTSGTPGEGGNEDTGSTGGDRPRRELGPSDAGERVAASIAEARTASFPTRAQLTGVVVTAVWSNNAATSGACAEATPRGRYASFWVADPSRPTDGLYVSKHCGDTPGDLQVSVGDVVDLDGFVGREKSFTDREGYRIVLKSQYDFLPAAARPGLPLVVSKRGTMAPPGDVPVSPGFGDARGGAELPGASYAGVRVHIPGPLELVDPRPAALRRLGGDGGSEMFFGFELTGGVLVNDFKTYRSTGADGGAGCNWRAVAADGGSVVFPDGVRGIWDTYTHAPCENGGTAGNCRRLAGAIPGLPDAGFTFILYPMDCETDLRAE